MSLHAHPKSDRKELAKTFLRLASSQYQEHRQHRSYYARIAREHGLTNQEIATEYGISEAAVRQMLQRAGK